MKVKHILPYTNTEWASNLDIHHDFTIGKWYDVVDNTTFDHPSYYIRNDYGIIKFMPKYYFISVEKERNNKLKEILEKK